MRKYFKTRDEEKKAALERIKMLFALAKQEFLKHPERAHRYGQMINDLIKKIRVRPPKYIRRYVCKECGYYLESGKNLKIKKEGNYLIYTCLNCGKTKKYGIGEKK